MLFLFYCCCWLLKSYVKIHFQISTHTVDARLHMKYDGLVEPSSITANIHTASLTHSYRLMLSSLTNTYADMANTRKLQCKKKTTKTKRRKFTITVTAKQNWTKGRPDVDTSTAHIRFQFRIAVAFLYTHTQTAPIMHRKIIVRIF